MKKSLTFISALLMLLSCTSCGGKSSQTADSSLQADTTISTEAETSTESTTVLSSDSTTTSSAAADSTTVKSTDGSSAGLSEMGQLTQALYDRIKNNKGQVEMKMSQKSEEMPDVKADVDVIVADKKMRFVMDFGNLFKMTMVGEGNEMYLLDDENKLYCKMDQNDSENPMTSENTPLLNEKGLGKFLGSGKSDFKGTKCTYEEYQSVTDENEDMDTKYYYNDKGDLIGFSTKKDGKEEMMDFSIHFYDEVKENLFKIPDGYKEGTTEEVMASVYSKMFAALLGGLEDLGDLDLSGSLGSTKRAS